MGNKGTLETSGYRRFWPMRQFEGRDAQGNNISTEGFRDMVSGEFHAPEEGWNGEPPPLPSGEKNLTTPENAYKENYRQTFGHD